MDRFSFLAGDSFRFLREGNVFGQIHQLEMVLSGMNYTPYTALEYLDTSYRLSLLYSLTKDHISQKKLLDKNREIEPLIAEFKRDAHIVSVLIEERLLKDTEKIEGRFELLKEAIYYSIKENKTLLLSRKLNDLGNYYVNIYQNDLASIHYLLSASILYNKRKQLSSEDYNSAIMYPYSNLISTMGEWNNYGDIKNLFFSSDYLDLSLISFWGLNIENIISNNKDSDLSNKFDRNRYEIMNKALYGKEGWESAYDNIVNQWGNIDKARECYENRKEELSSSERTYFEICLDFNSESVHNNLGAVDNDFFYRNIWLFAQCYDFLERADKDTLLQKMIDNVQHRNNQLQYDQAKFMIDDIESGKSLFAPYRAGHILLDHAGSNGIYESAVEIINWVNDFIGLPEGTSWIKDSISWMRLPSLEMEEGLYKSIIESLDKHCTYVPYYKSLVENLYIIRSLFSGEELFIIDTLLLERVKDYKKVRILTNELSSLGGGISGSRTSDSEVYSTISGLFSVYENNGFAHHLFERVDYSTRDVNGLEVDDQDQDNVFSDSGSSRIAGVRKALQESPNYIQLKKQAERCGWIVDESDLNLNFIIWTRKHEAAALYLFDETEYDTWLADEERFNDEDPLWFSERSHTVSPVFKINHYDIAQGVAGCRKIVVMMPDTNVVNAEDMVDIWGDVLVVKWSDLFDSLKETGELPTSVDPESLSELIHRNDPEESFGHTDSKGKTEKSLEKSAEDRVRQNAEEEKKKRENEFNNQWNLSRLYKDYYLRSFNVNNPDPSLYNPYNSVLRIILDNLGFSPNDHVEVDQAELIIYFKVLPVKFKMRGRYDDTQSRRFILESFSVDSYRESELVIDRQYGNDDLDFISVVGNIAEDECSIVYRFCPRPNFRKLGKDVQLKNRQEISVLFRDILTYGWTVEDWRRSISSVSRALLYDKIKQLAEKTAKSAIMSRNMSHNLGSHVMAYLKRDLFSVSDIIQKGVLQDFYPISDLMEMDSPKTLEDILRILDDRSKTIEMPFLVGLGRFISYLQERQDFIATVATDYCPYFSVVNFKDDIYDTLNPDYRYYRHMDRRGGRPENLLMKYIALSEGLTRSGGVVESNDRKNDIVIKFRNFDGVNDYRNQKNRGRTKARGIGAADLEDLRTYSLSLPGGIVGRQAIFSILENLIRNSAKHGRWEKEKDNLEFSFDIFNGSTLSSDERSRDLFVFLAAEPQWKEALTLTNSPLGDYLVLTLTDNLLIGDSDYEALRKAIKEPYVDDNAVFIDNHKGIKEIRICAAWIRGINNDLHLNPGEPPVVTVRLVDGHLQYIFCVFSPVRVIAVSDNYRDELSFISKGWKSWKVMSSEDFVLSKHKNSDVILVIGEDERKRIEPFAPDRIVLSDINEALDILVDDDSNPRNEDEVFAELVSLAYNVDLENDYPILISDGKTPAPLSSHIHLVADDAQVIDNYYFAYRSHHQFDREFKEYMNGNLCKNMIGIEGITGGNSTDRLVRSEKLDDVWYAKHLCSLRTRVAIFDERLFSKVTGLDDAQLISIPDNSWIKASRDALVQVQKRTWFFNVIARPDRQGFDIFGYRGFIKDEDGNYHSCIGRVATIGIKRLELFGSLGIPCIEIKQFSEIDSPNGDAFVNIFGFFDYISVHQGLMDKLYDFLCIKSPESYSIELRNNTKELKRAMDTAKAGIVSSIYLAFKEGKNMQVTPDAEGLTGFKRGLFIHSGRSKPSEHDMPQKLPFIQYAAIENAVYDCKFTLVELMKSALYE